MKLTLNDYRNIIPSLQYSIENKGIKTVEEVLSEVSVTSHVPIVALCCYYLELYPQDIIIWGLKNRLVKFYGYTEVK
jgi:hypothetical protein